MSSYWIRGAALFIGAFLTGAAVQMIGTDIPASHFDGLSALRILGWCWGLLFIGYIAGKESPR